MKLYKDWTGYVCMHPECVGGGNIEVHHIFPVKQGGKDEYWNFISMCRKCHHSRKHHIEWEHRCTELFTYKSYWELKLFGFVLDEKDKDYYENLRSLLYKDTRTEWEKAIDLLLEVYR